MMRKFSHSIEKAVWLHIRYTRRPSDTRPTILYKFKSPIISTLSDPSKTISTVHNASCELENLRIHPSNDTSNLSSAMSSKHKHEPESNDREILERIGVAARGTELVGRSIFQSHADNNDEDMDRIRELILTMNTDQPLGGIDAVYGPNTRHRIRIWRASLPDALLVVFVHGGSWQSGTHLDSIGSAKVEHLLARGYAFASVDYQLVPEVTVEELTQEVANALAYLAGHASLFGFDSHSIVLMGHSSGAHVAALLGTDSTYLQNAGLDIAFLRGVICLDGSNYNALAELIDSPGPVADNTIRGLGTEPARLRAMSPTYHASAPNAAAFLLLHVQRAGDVRQAVEFAGALSAAGTDVELHVFEGNGFEGHVQMLLRLGNAEYPATVVMDGWLDRYATCVKKL